MIQNIKLTQISPSKTNPRKRFDEGELAQLADNIKLHGVLQPILVREIIETRHKDFPDPRFEIVAGERRYRAAKLAGKEDIPAIVRELDDLAVLEIQVIENLQRSDLHPLEEAAGYRLLLITKQYDVARIAEKVGRSTRYVYDRVKLLELIPEIQKHFIEDTITAGHAVLLARLSPADQKKALGGKNGDRWQRGEGLFTHEASLLDTEDDDGSQRVKAVSVKELERWIATHVKFDRAKVDPMLFPETAEAVAEATEQKAKIIPITRSYRSSDDIRKAGKERIYGEQAWKRADGIEQSKACEYSMLGVIVDGVGYGEAFKVCVNKDKCVVHWAAEVKNKAKLAKARATGDTKTVAKAEKKAAKQEQSWEESRKREQAEQVRWEKAWPKILEHAVGKIKGAPIGAIADLVMAEAWRYSATAPKVEKLLPRGKTADDLLRHAAAGVALGHGFSVNSFRDIAKALGINVKELLNAHAPVEKPKVEAKKRTPAKPKRAKR